VGLLSVDGVAVQAEEFLVAYLSPTLVNVATEMEASPPLPFFLVKRITGGEDMVSDYAVVSIHCFATSRTAASDAATSMHAKMKALNAKTSVTVGGKAYGVDFRYVEEVPFYVDYEDKTLRRFVGRYRLGLRLLKVL